MSEMITAPGRSINTITAEIITITTQTSQMVVMNAIEIGRRLVEAKGMVSHGEWGDYLKKEVKFSQSTANNCMKLFNEWTKNPNSQALGNLTYTKALQLLALPDGEREEFLETHDVESMSSRELSRAIKERDSAQELLAIAQGDNEQLRRELDAAGAAASKAEKAAEKLQADKLAAEQEVSRLNSGLAKVKKEAAEKAQKEYQDQLDAARQELVKANQARASAEQALEQARKSVQMANPDNAAFEALLLQWQDVFNRLHGHMLKVSATNPKTAKAMQQVLQKALLTQAERIR